MSYIDLIKDRARLEKKTIVLPESNDKRTLIAAAKIMEEGIANIIMIGNEEKITDGAGWLEVDLTNVKNGARLLNGMLGEQDVRINARTGMLAGTVGEIQNRHDNSDVISAIKDLKEGLNNNGPSYTINGITYDDGSNVVNAVETLVRAARIERRI